MYNEGITNMEKLNGRNTDDYKLWRLYCEIALEGKSFWSKLESKTCNQDVKDISSAMTVDALGEMALCLCSGKVGEPLEMVNFLDKRFASTRMHNRVSFLTVMYSKLFSSETIWPSRSTRFGSLSIWAMTIGFPSRTKRFYYRKV